MIVALEEDRDLVRDEQLVDGEGPGRAVLGEAGGAVGVLAAPLVQGGHINATALRAHHVVGEDKFILRLALLERGLEPEVLRIAVRDGPHVRALVATVEVIVDAHRRAPVRIDRHKKGIAACRHHRES